MIIPASEAEAFFSHPSQRKGAKPGDALPDWMEYRVNGDVCLATHWTHVPGLLLCHVGVKPTAWGTVREKVLPLLHDAWGEHQPDRIGGWIGESNKAACALARRCGFVEDGRVPLGETVILYGWRP